MLMFLVFNFCFNIVESRVYCQDSNALVWKPHGFSCPVQCATIVQAIVKLQHMDYIKVIHEEIGYKENGEVDLKEIEKHVRAELLESRRSFNTPEVKRNITGMDNFVNDDKRKSSDKLENNMVSGNNMETENKMAYVNGILGNCWVLDKFEPIQLIVKLKRVQCTRRAIFDNRLLTIMTDILNRHVGAPFQFNKEITEIILMKLLSKGTDLRYNIIDISQFIRYLERAIQKNNYNVNRPSIKLRSKHCLTVALSGCFCKSGYVENNGQCVRPTDCKINEIQAKYLPRIIVQ